MGMMRLLKKIFLTLVFLFSFGAVWAQNVDFTVKVPSPVAVGKMFKVEFSLNEQPESVPVMPQIDGLEVVAGPVIANRVQSEYSGGKLRTVAQYLYTYTMVGRKEGVYTIPSVSVVVDGKTFKTKSTHIDVVAESESQTPGSSTVGPNDLILRAIVDKTEVYKGEPVRVMVKLFAKSVALADYAIAKLPSFNGFWTQELDTRQYGWQREKYNSQVYQTRVVREYLLYPQQSGTLQIDQFNYELMLRVILEQRQSSNLIEEFMGGMHMTENVIVNVSSPPVKITVSEWPAGAPVDFKGAVGNFNMTADFPQGDVYANSSANVSVKVSGSGNLPMIQAPTLSAPTSFEQYNIKTTESLSLAQSGIYGYRQYDYPIIPRAEGLYTIDPVVFTYFNPETKEYVTVKSEPHQLRVLADSTSTGASVASGTLVGGLSREDLKILEEYIRFIERGNHGLTKRKGVLMCSATYFGLLGGLFVVFAGLLIYLQKRRKAMSNVDAMRGKKANKVALQRLKAAENYMKTDAQHKFYEEILRALWGYMSDKLNIPVAALTKENVREGLLKRNIPANVVTPYIELITDCEYAQYAPGASAQLQDVYARAVGVISKLESAIKK